MVRRPSASSRERERRSSSSSFSSGSRQSSREVGRLEMESLLDNPVEQLLSEESVRRFLPRSRIRSLICTVCIVVVLGICLNLTVSRKLPRLVPNYEPGPGKPIAKWKYSRTSSKSKSSGSSSMGSVVGENGTAVAVTDDASKKSTQQSASSSWLWQELKSMLSWGDAGDNVDEHHHYANSTSGLVSGTTIPKSSGSTPAVSGSNNEPRISPKPSPIPAKQRPGLPAAPKPKASDIPRTPYKYTPDVIPKKSNVSTHFVERWCDMSAHGGKEVDWYPRPPNVWQRRAPAFLIPGAKFAGVPQLAALLAKHPQIAAPTPLDVNFFFRAQRFVRNNEKTQVYSARQRMYAHHFYPTSTLKRDPNVISFDATPGYLLYSAITPRRIFCVAPWVKLVIVLQDPVNRLVQHYLAAQKKGLPLSFEKWVEKDLHLMRHVGLLNKTAGSPEEDVAWYEYTSSTLEGAVGRSLYDIQLRHWMQAIMALGKHPRRSVLLVRAADFVKQPAGYFKRILQFVGVNETAMTLSKDYPLKLEIPPPNITTKVMTVSFKQKLNDLFRPFQQRLPNTLKRYGIQWAQPLQ